MFSTAIEWVAKKHLSIPHLIHILDNYFMAAPTYHQCCIDLARFSFLSDYLGVPMRQKKTVGPSNILTFAGIELDSLRMEALLPLDKTEKCNVIVSAFLRKKFTLREIQSLTGLLNFARSVLVPGRAFFASLDRFDEGNEICLLFCPSSKSVKADLEIWRFLLDDFNGRSIFFAMYGLIRLV